MDHISRKGKRATEEDLAREVSVSLPTVQRWEANGANSIGNLISRIREDLSEYPQRVIVIDDGSSGQTSEIGCNNGTVVISYEKNLGKSAAMKTGGQNAKGMI